MSIATEIRRKSRTDIPATGQEPKHAKLLAWLDAHPDATAEEYRAMMPVPQREPKVDEVD